VIKLVVLGDPVSHSRSPAIHRAGLRVAGISGEYTARRVDGDGMRSAADEIRSGALTGANITTPHKHLAAELADRRSELVERLGAANTWWREPNGTLVAENTDVAGVAYAFGQIGMPDSVVVLGAGGAAAAALVAVNSFPGSVNLAVSTRNERRARLLLDQLDLGAEFVPWGEPVGGAVLVNATRIGMAGEDLPEGLLAAASGFIDMPYGDAATPAVVEAGRLGIPCSPGLDMLIGQAMAAFTIWTGVAADHDAMVSAARRRT
jgi:shikimate dehydrogenase